MGDTKRRLSATEKHRKRAARCFAREVEGYEMSVLHEDGLYRHVRFQRPDSGMYWFDLVTWPKNLTISMDGLAYTFCAGATDDMFAFFPASGHSSDGINPGYWAEAVKADRDSVWTYEPELLIEWIRDDLRETYEGDAEYRLGKVAKHFGFHDVEQLLAFIKPWPEDDDEPDPEVIEARQMVKAARRTTREYMRQLRANLSRYLLPYSWVTRTWEEAARGTSHLSEAHEALRDFEFRFDGDADDPDAKDHKFEFVGWEEAKLRTWDWHFLRASHYIRWGVAQYDAAKAAEQPEAVTANV